MGSFSYSCVLTGLPICSGDQVVLLPLRMRDKLWDNSETSVRKAGKSSFVSNEGERVFFTEGTYPIFGKYNDYGGIEDIEKDDNTKAIEEYFGVTIEEFCMYLCCGRKDGWETDEFSDCYGIDKKTDKYKEIVCLSATWFRRGIYDKLVIDVPDSDFGSYDEMELGNKELLEGLGFEFMKDLNEGMEFKETQKNENRYHYLYQKGKIKVKSDGTWINISTSTKESVFTLAQFVKYCKNHGEELDITKVNFPSLAEQIYELKLPTIREEFLKKKEDQKIFDALEEKVRIQQEKVWVTFTKRGATADLPSVSGFYWYCKCAYGPQSFPIYDQNQIRFINKLAGENDILDTNFYLVSGDIKKTIREEYKIEETEVERLNMEHIILNFRSGLATRSDPEFNHIDFKLFCAPDWSWGTNGFFKFAKDKVLENLDQKFMKWNIINWMIFRPNMYYLGKYLAPVGTSPQCGEHKLVKRIYEKALEVVGDDLKNRDEENDDIN